MRIEIFNAPGVQGSISEDHVHLLAWIMRYCGDVRTRIKMCLLCGPPDAMPCPHSPPRADTLYVRLHFSPPPPSAPSTKDDADIAFHLYANPGCKTPPLPDWTPWWERRTERDAVPPFILLRGPSGCQLDWIASATQEAYGQGNVHLGNLTGDEFQGVALAELVVLSGDNYQSTLQLCMYLGTPCLVLDPPNLQELKRGNKCSWVAFQDTGWLNSLFSSVSASDILVTLRQEAVAARRSHLRASSHAYREIAETLLQVVERIRTV